jgi:hypothetical protein
VTTEEKLAFAISALRFYAEPLRYHGSNQQALPGDQFQPEDLYYRLDVTRDGGRIAAETLRKIA